jgi:hypothetical protein
MIYMYLNKDRVGIPQLVLPKQENPDLNSLVITPPSVSNSITIVFKPYFYGYV